MRRALAILAFDALVLIGIGLHLAHASPALASGLFWGVPGGLVCSVSAVGLAVWAERRRMSIKRALAVLVSGMLFRMFFLAGWTLVAILLGGAHALSYLVGFGGVYLVGQGLEIWLLARLGRGSGAGLVGGT
mgnify:FL=1